MSKFARILALILGIVSIFHLWSIDTYIQSWIDLSVFHDVANSFIHGEGFYPQSNPLFNVGREMVIYGPIYFIMEGLAIIIGGTSHFAASFPGVMFIFLFGILIFKSLKSNIGIPFIIGLLLLLFTDPQFSSALHNGRMDIIACFLSFYIFLTTIKFGGTQKEVILIGVLSSLAFLTTPRITPIILPSIVYILYYLIIVKKDYKKLSVLIVIPLVLISLWVYFGFGGFQNAYNYFFVDKTLHLNKSGNLASKFVGGSFTIQRTQYLLYFLTFTSIVLLLLKQGKSLLQKRWFFISISTILIYHFVIVDFGNYTVLVVYIIYFLFVKCLNELKGKTPKLLLSALTLHNLFIFGVISSFVIVSYPYNKSSVLNEFVQKNIESGAKVSGLPLHYFGALENNNSFRTWSNLEIDVTENERQIFNEVKVDYLILKQWEFDNLKKKNYNLTYEKIDELDFSKEYYQEYRDLLNQYKVGGDFLNKHFDFSGSIIYKVHYPND